MGIQFQSPKGDSLKINCVVVFSSIEFLFFFFEVNSERKSQVVSWRCFRRDELRTHSIDRHLDKSSGDFPLLSSTENFLSPFLWAAWNFAERAAACSHLTFLWAGKLFGSLKREENDETEHRFSSLSHFSST